MRYAKGSEGHKARVAWLRNAIRRDRVLLKDLQSPTALGLGGTKEAIRQVKSRMKRNQTELEKLTKPKGKAAGGKRKAPAKGAKARR